MATLQDFFNTGDDSDFLIDEEGILAQTFTANGTYTITSFKAKLRYVAGDGNLAFYLLNTLESGEPDVTGFNFKLAEGTVDVTTLPTSNTLFELTFDAGYEVQSGTQYALYLGASSSSSLELYWRYASSGSYSGGQLWEFNDSTQEWDSYSDYDALFETYSADATEVTLVPQTAIKRLVAAGNNQIYVEDI